MPKYHCKRFAKINVCHLFGFFNLNFKFRDFRNGWDKNLWHQIKSKSVRSVISTFIDLKQGLRFKREEIDDVATDICGITQKEENELKEKAKGKGSISYGSIPEKWITFYVETYSI